MFRIPSLRPRQREPIQIKPQDYLAADGQTIGKIVVGSGWDVAVDKSEQYVVGYAPKSGRANSRPLLPFRRRIANIKLPINGNTAGRTVLEIAAGDPVSGLFFHDFSEKKVSKILKVRKAVCVTSFPGEVSSEYQAGIHGSSPEAHSGSHESWQAHNEEHFAFSPERNAGIYAGSPGRHSGNHDPWQTYNPDDFASPERQEGHYAGFPGQHSGHHVASSTHSILQIEPRAYQNVNRTPGHIVRGESLHVVVDENEEYVIGYAQISDHSTVRHLLPFRQGIANVKLRIVGNTVGSTFLAITAWDPVYSLLYQDINAEVVSGRFTIREAVCVQSIHGMGSTGRQEENHVFFSEHQANHVFSPERQEGHYAGSPGPHSGNHESWPEYNEDDFASPERRAENPAVLSRSQSDNHASVPRQRLGNPLNLIRRRSSNQANSQTPGPAVHLDDLFPSS